MSEFYGEQISENSHVLSGMNDTFRPVKNNNEKLNTDNPLVTPESSTDIQRTEISGLPNPPKGLSHVEQAAWLTSYLLANKRTQENS
jgi:hypothetical protein